MDNHCFIFLKDEYPDWCEECEKMEKYIIDGDGHTAIIISGKVCENIILEICKKENITDCGKNQFDRLECLKRKDKLSKDELDSYHAIRLIRNDEVHNNQIDNEMAEAYQSHQNLYKVSTEFYRNYIDSDYDFPKYTQPKSIYSQETIIEQNSNSHNVNTENSNNTVNITNITHNHHYSQKNELKANKTEVHNNKKMGEEDEMDRKTLVLGIIAIVAILVIALSFFASTSDNSSTDLQDTSQVSSSDSGSVAS